MPNNWKTYTVGELILQNIIEKPLDGNHGGTHPKGSDFINEGNIPNSCWRRVAGPHGRLQRTASILYTAVRWVHVW